MSQHELLELGLLFAGLVALTLVRPIYVRCTQAPADLSRIRASYEGLLSPKGPNSKVVGVRRCGTTWGDRSSPPARLYEVRVVQFNGDELLFTVAVESSIFGYGSMFER